MSIFLSFSSKDRQYVSEFILESKKKRIPVWAALDRSVSSGKDFIKLINNKIQKSNGAIILVSKNSINSKFINEVELPKILNKSQKTRSYKIIPILIDDSDVSNHPVYKNIEMLNSNSTSLDSLTGRQYELIIKECINEFKYVLRKKIIKYAGIFIVLSIIVLTLFQNINEISSSEYTERENQFLASMNSEETQVLIGNVSQISDEDFLMVGNLVCDILSQNVAAFMAYDIAYFNLGLYLTNLGLTGGENGDVTPLNITSAVDLLYTNANESLCDNVVIDNLGFSKMAVFNELNYNFEFRSDTYRFIFQDSAIEDSENIYTNKFNSEIIEAINIRDSFLFLFLNGCDAFLQNPYESLPYIQSLFSEFETLEEQNMFHDELEIISTIVPYIHCPDLADNGVSLITGLYLIDFNFEPEF